MCEIIGLNSNITTQTGKINIYVGNDKKLHFVNSTGADSVLNFNNGGYVVCNHGLGSLNNQGSSTYRSGTYCTFKGIKSFKYHFYHVRAGYSYVADNGTTFCIKNEGGQWDYTYEVPNPEEVHTITWWTNDWFVFYISSITWVDGIVD